MKNYKIFYLFFILSIQFIFVSATGLAAGSGDDPFATGANLPAATTDGTSSSSTTWPSLPETNMNSQIRMIGQTKVVGGEGLSQSGNSFHVDSAQSIFTGGFVFNDVGSTNIAAEGNKLIFATVVSAKDNNVFFIKNPTDPYEIERIAIMLNASQAISYSFDGENATIALPEKSKMLVIKGSKNVTIEPNGANTEVTIDNSKIIGDKGAYDKPRYTIFNANLTYQNKDIMERLVTQGEASVRIDTEKGFGYLLLNGKVDIRPGDTYEYYDLKKKEKSYSLYNPGSMAFEYGFLKAGFVYDLLPVINLALANYGFEGSEDITLRGIIEYKRIQSFNQLKAIAGTYENYRAMQLPFLPVYSSGLIGNEYRITNRGDSYTASHIYDPIADEGRRVISKQSVGRHAVRLEAKSPPEYYWRYSSQDCPDYGVKTAAAGERIAGDVRLENGTLAFRNWRIYTPGTRDYDGILSRLRQMIITNTPSDYGSVDLG